MGMTQQDNALMDDVRTEVEEIKTPENNVKYEPNAWTRLGRTD